MLLRLLLLLPVEVPASTLRERVRVSVLLPPLPSAGRGFGDRRVEERPPAPVAVPMHVSSPSPVLSDRI
jgi:hypothetical protein